MVEVSRTMNEFTLFCIFHACVVTYWPFHSKTKWNITITLFVSINILTEMPKMTTAKLQWTNPLQLLMENPHLQTRSLFALAIMNFYSIVVSCL